MGLPRSAALKMLHRMRMWAGSGAVTARLATWFGGAGAGCTCEVFASGAIAAIIAPLNKSLTTVPCFDGRVPQAVPWVSREPWHFALHGFLHVFLLGSKARCSCSR